MPQQLPEDYLLIARIGAAYGVKGWVKLISFTDPRANIMQYRHFLTPGIQAGERAGESGKESGKGMQEIEIDQSKAQGKGFVAHIKGCDDRGLTRLYTGMDLYIEKSRLPRLDEEEYYWYQLEGLRVINLTGEYMGRVDHLLETGANDVLVVKADDHSIDDRERLIPFLRGQVITEIDLQQAVITVDWERDY